jgi:hypothetical protein
MTTALDWDALAVLVVRLASDKPAAEELRWHRWYEIHGAGEHGLDPDSRAEDASPHKQLPVPERQPYFTAHVQHLLYPPPAQPHSSSPERRMCCPSELSLDLGWNQGNVRRARIDLLERLTIPLDPSHSVGLIHLALQPDVASDATATLKWASDLRQAFTTAGRPRFTLIRGSREDVLDQRRPLRGLVTALFGDPDEELERHFYTIVFAKEPAELPAGEVDRPSYLAGWRRALARGSRRVEDGMQAEQRDPEKAAAQYASLGAVNAVVLGRGAAFTARPDTLNGSYARNFRSYWSESLLFALLQHDRLEHFAGRLAELGFDPSTESLDQLFDEWLAFRNMLWWSQLSTATDVPQTLVDLLRAEYGTERLFSKLEGDFTTYTARRRWRMEDEQAHALANLQIYGAAVAVTGALATIAALLHPSGPLLALVVCAVIVAGIAAGTFVRTRLPRQTRTPRRTGSPR